MEAIRVERREGLVTITLDRQAKKNAIDGQTWILLDHAFAEVAGDPSDRALILTGAGGIVIAKEAFRLVEQLQGYQGEEVASYLFHAFGTNLQFEDDEFNFVKTRAEHGAKQAFDLCKAHFSVPEP